jgi:DNA modification methylase
MKPLKLIARQVRNSSQPGEKVLDLFGGSGTTLIACEQMDRQCFMMEFDPHYADVIVARWEKMTGQKAVKISEYTGEERKAA